MEHTFRPFYYHRNTMSEFVGNISRDSEDSGKGFRPGCCQLQSCMTAHGPSAALYKGEFKEDGPQKPARSSENSMQFMFESCYMLKTTKWAFNGFLEAEDDLLKQFDELKTLKYPAEE